MTPIIFLLKNGQVKHYINLNRKDRDILWLVILVY